MSQMPNEYGSAHRGSIGPDGSGTTPMSVFVNFGVAFVDALILMFHFHFHFFWTGVYITLGFFVVLFFVFDRPMKKARERTLGVNRPVSPGAPVQKAKLSSQGVIMFLSVILCLLINNLA